MESYKNKSRMWTILMMILTSLSVVSVDQWQAVLPNKYMPLAPLLVTVLGFLVAQLTEEKRVSCAEELVHGTYTMDDDSC